MRKIKIAQIGTSIYSHGNEVWRTLKKQTDIFEIVGYAFPENEKEKFPTLMNEFEGFQEMTVEEILSDSEIEAVTVETEEVYLTKYAIMAAKAGKNIHMEKPGGRERFDFEELIRLMRENKKVFHTGYMYRYNPYVIELLEKIKSGDFGEIVSVEAQMNCRHPKELREWFKHFKGGIMFFLGCHLVDLIFQIQGEPENIIPLNRSTGLDGLHTEDFGMAVFEYKTGVSFAKVNSTETGGFLRRQLVVSGTKATAEIKPLEKLVEGGLVTSKAYCDFDDWRTETTGVYDRYEAMMSSFAAMVRGEKKNPYTLDYELALYHTILKACGGI